jgi:uncharacterized membrane protein
MSPTLAFSKAARFSSLVALGLLGAPALALAQTTAKPPSGAPAQQKKPLPAPAAPQSKHYPILLIASGPGSVWSLRIGMKGAERLDRAGYPPIPLDPGEIAQEGAAGTAGASGTSGTAPTAATSEAWLYHAKDSATQADVTARVSREACSDGVSDTKYTFRVTVTHAQLGEFQGCAKIAPDQFPEFKQKNLDDDDPDKKKPPTVITNFKPPTAVAYIDSAGKVMLARGEAAKLVAPKGSQLSLSHDGKRLLYTREDAGGDHTIVLYDAVAAKSTDLLHGGVQSAFWSPDDTQIAFLKSAGQGWQVWLMPSNAPDKAAELASTPVVALQGWQDVHTVLATDASRLYFLKTESPPSSVDLHDLYGTNFQIAASDSLRASPANPDLLAITAAGAGGSTSSVFLVEIKSKRRVALTAPNVFANAAEWSRDGIQVFYTQRDAAKNLSVNRIFWDGSGVKRIRPGSGLVIGQ